MSKRLTITIPDEVHKRLEPYRNSLNISYICSFALSEAMEDFENCIIEAKTRFQILTTSEACKLAYTQGVKWAGFYASPVELAVVCNWIESEKDSDFIDLLSFKFEKVRKIISGYSNVYEYIINSSFVTKEIFSNSIDYFHEDAEIANSFIDGAKIVWSQIKNETISKLMDSEK